MRSVFIVVKRNLNENGEPINCPVEVFEDAWMAHREANELNMVHNTNIYSVYESTPFWSARN